MFSASGIGAKMRRPAEKWTSPRPPRERLRVEKSGPTRPLWMITPRQRSNCTSTSAHSSRMSREEFARVWQRCGGWCRWRARPRRFGAWPHRAVAAGRARWWRTWAARRDFGSTGRLPTSHVLSFFPRIQEIRLRVPGYSQFCCPERVSRHDDVFWMVSFSSPITAGKRRPGTMRTSKISSTSGLALERGDRAAGRDVDAPDAALEFR